MNRTTSDSTGAAVASFRSYATGFTLSLLLTIIAFALVMSSALSRSATIVGIFGTAVVQILVHLHYFLHLNTSSSSRWNVMALLFTLVIMALFFGGTIWIMVHLKYRLQ
jgi:cytochrome o ubiquinol oxidase operon protein cyoD